ncbi:MAG: penicillin-binding protein [Microbacteriaceae bacterium]|nr:penicillin-binding protein [Microbacteriaceae bacterium]MCL2796268.1 penicillin-binding protein [Microbacteriaceae bacterium]
MRILAKLGALVGFAVAAVAAGVLAAATLVPLAVVGSQGVNGTLGAYFAMPDYLQIGSPQQISTMYAQDGHGHNVAIARFYSQDRAMVTSAQIGQIVKDAAIDTEDPRFYSEGGVDLIGTVRATLSTALGHGDNVQGGSTITQQYVKNVLVQQCVELPTQKQVDACYLKASGITPQRKLQEIRYASALDRSYTKSQVLTGYLNIVGLGGNVYGVQAGAEYYFGVDAAHLSIPQAATLVAILNNPNNLRIDEPNDPYNGSKNHYAATLDRRNYVLQRMLVHKSITEAEYDAALKTPITPKITQQSSGCATAAKYDAAYYCSYVRSTLLADPSFGKTAADRVQKLDTDGLKIYTPLRLDLQRQAQSALSAYVPAHTAGVNIGGANVTVKPGSGQIVTMVQNTRYSDVGGPGATSVNYSTDQAYGGSIGFQTGSTFKAFSLVEWLKEGHHLNDYVSTGQKVFPFADFHNSCENIGNSVWNVSNAEGDNPPAVMSVEQATAQSINSAFAKMGEQLDLCAIANDAKAMGVHLAATNGTFQEYPSMILGVNEISPLTMASAYAGFADHGVVCTPVAVSKIVDASGHGVGFTHTKCHQAIPANIANTVEYALRAVLQPGGTGATANPGGGTPIFAKTGTTDGDQQNWIVASTTNYTNAIWVGNAVGQVNLDKFPLLQGTTGYTVKFGIAHQILGVLDAALGGGPLAGPDQNLVGAVAPPPAVHGPAKPGKPTTPKSPTAPQQPGKPGKGKHGG